VAIGLADKNQRCGETWTMGGPRVHLARLLLWARIAHPASAPPPAPPRT